MTNVNQAPLPRLSKRRWYVLRLLSGAISSTWLYFFIRPISGAPGYHISSATLGMLMLSTGGAKGGGSAQW